MDVLQNLRTRVMIIVLGLVWVYLITHDTVVWQWVATAGLVLWFINLYCSPSQSPSPPQTPSTSQSPSPSALVWAQRKRTVYVFTDTVIDPIVWIVTIRALVLIISPLKAVEPRFIIAGILSVAAVVFSILLFLQLRAGQPIEIRAHWGGLGGNQPGWRVSTPLICLIAALLFGLFAAMLSMPLQSSSAPPPGPNRAAS